MPRAGTLAVLLVLTAVAMTQVEEPLVVGALLPFLMALLAIDLDRDSATRAAALVRVAARLLPKSDREDLRDEWLDHVASAGEHGLAPLGAALSIAVVAAPLLAVGLRVGRRRRATG